MSDAGTFVIAWQAEKQDDPDNSRGIFAQRYDADGTLREGEFLVNSTTARLVVEK